MFSLAPRHECMRWSGGRVQLRAFLTSELDRGEWSVLRPDRYNPDKETAYPLDETYLYVPVVVFSTYTLVY
jgi:hypothetical protein